jgi:CRISPR-associated protein Csa3
MILIVTLGFDEKFALRAIMRRGIKEGDKLIALLPKKGDPRGEKAFLTLKQTLLNMLPKLEVEMVEVNLQDPYEAISNLRKLFKSLSLKGEELILNLSGGQRLLIIETLAAALSLDLRNMKFELETEDSSLYFTSSLDIMLPMDLDKVDLSILQKVAEKGSIKLTDMVNEIECPKTTLWRKLNRLAELKLVEKDNDYYSLSDLGRSRLERT